MVLKEIKNKINLDHMPHQRATQALGDPFALSYMILLHTMESVALRMTDAHMEKVEALLDNKPEVYSGFGGGGWQRRLDTL